MAPAWFLAHRREFWASLLSTPMGSAPAKFVIPHPDDLFCFCQEWSAGLRACERLRRGPHWTSPQDLGQLQVAAIGAFLSRDPAEISTCVRRYDQFGLGKGLDNSIVDIHLDETSLRILSSELDGRPPYLSEVSVVHLARASWKLEIRIREVLDLIKSLKGRGS